MIFTHKEIQKNIDEVCDVCVVGSGAGGAPVAKELAEAGLNVILLEEGSYYTTSDFQHSRTDKALANLYRDGGASFSIGKPQVYFAEGRCVGGSTTLNGGMCWRTPDKILKRWQWEYGLNGLTPKKMDFYFERVEKIVSAKAVLPDSMNQDSLLLKKGSDKLAYRIKANTRNHHYCVGANQCLSGCPTGGKQSTLVTYIPAFIKSGGRLYANCRVKKIKRKGSHVRGVQGVVIDPDTKKVKAKLRIRCPIVVVSAGASQTPALLLRSRIPDDSKMIGKNLFMHPNTKVAASFDERVEGWKGVTQAFQITEFMDEGIIMGVTFPPIPIFPLALPFYGQKFIDRLPEIYHNTVFGAALIEDTSRGRVWSLPADQLLIQYQLNQRDFELALRGIALLAEVYFAAGAKTVYLPFHNFQEIHTIDEIRKIYEYKLKPQDLDLMTVHIMGTCQMGADPKRSVVNSYGESHQVKGLFVADASIFPTSIGVNPAISIMSLATRTAFHIAENASRYLS